jgi:hypothetical protein
MLNASEAREAVYELFQDLDGFSLDEYEPLSHTSKDVQVITDFVRGAAEFEGLKFLPMDDSDFRIENDNGGVSGTFTPDRDKARSNKEFELLGLDHPYVVEHQRRFLSIPAGDLGIRVKSVDGRSGLLGVWRVETEDEGRQRKVRLIPIAVTSAGERIPAWERKPEDVFHGEPQEISGPDHIELYRNTIEPIFERELKHRGIVTEGTSFQAELVGWVEVGGS